MGRTVTIVRRTRPMRDRATPGSGLAPGAVTPAAPGAGAELELFHLARHLNRADVYHKLASV